MPRDCLSLPLDKGLGVFRDCSGKLCLHENDSTCFCSSSKHGAGSEGQGWISKPWISLSAVGHAAIQQTLGETLQPVTKCCYFATLWTMHIMCCKHKHLNPCSVCAFAKRMDDIKDFHLYCIIYSLVFKMITRENGYAGLLRWSWWDDMEYRKLCIQL